MKAAASLCLAIAVTGFASPAAISTEDTELRDLDVTEWDCANQSEGSQCRRGEEPTAQFRVPVAEEWFADRSASPWIIQRLGIWIESTPKRHRSLNIEIFPRIIGVPRALLLCCSGFPKRVGWLRRRSVRLQRSGNRRTHSDAATLRR